MSITERIHALHGASKLHLDAAFQKADDAYRQAREAARYAADDLRAAERADRDDGRATASAATEKAQAVLDAAKADLKIKRERLDAERERFGKVFLRDLDATAIEIGELTLVLSNAAEALRGHAWTIANFASLHDLPIHRAFDHAAGLDSVVRRLRFQG